MAKLFDEPLCQTNEERTNLLLKHHIALWDVVHSCDIEGASDASIAHVEPNDLTLITSTATIQAIFCTGSKAAQLYRRYCEKNVGTPCIALPSTSPANAIWSLPDLLEAYRVILKYLDDRPTPSQLKGSQV